MMYTKGFNRNGAGVGAGQENDRQVVDSEETPVEQALVQEADTEDEKGVSCGQGIPHHVM